MDKNLSAALRAATGRALRGIASDIGAPHATFTRQAGNETMSPQTLIAVCRTYDLNLIELLESAGYITAGEARSMKGATGLEAYTQLELAEEVYNRELAEALERKQNVTVLSERRHSVSAPPMYDAAKHTTHDVPEDDTP